MIDKILNVIGIAMIGILLFMFGCLILLFFAAALGEIPSQKHYRECVADGHKEYECYAMIYGGGVKR